MDEIKGRQGELMDEIKGRQGELMDEITKEGRVS